MKQNGQEPCMSNISSKRLTFSNPSLIKKRTFCLSMQSLLFSMSCLIVCCNSTEKCKAQSKIILRTTKMTRKLSQKYVVPKHEKDQPRQNRFFPSNLVKCNCSMTSHPVAGNHQIPMWIPPLPNSGKVTKWPCPRQGKKWILRK